MARLALLLSASLQFPCSMGASLRQSLRLEGLSVDRMSSFDMDLHSQNAFSGQRQNPETLDALFAQAAIKEQQSNAQKAQLEETTSSEASPAQQVQPEGSTSSEASPTHQEQHDEMTSSEALPVPAAAAGSMLRETPSTAAVPSEGSPAPAGGTEAIPFVAVLVPTTGADSGPQGTLSSEAVPEKALVPQEAQLAGAIESEAAPAPHAGTEVKLSDGLTAPAAEAANSTDDQSRRVSLEQHQRLQQVKPITWFHVPKCGTTFANTLFHHPDICPKFPEKALISRVKAGIPATMLKMILGMPGMYGVDIGKFTPDSLDDLCDHSIDTRLQGLGHNAIGQHWSEVSGHSMIFLRQPEQRIISAYRHGRHGCLTCSHETSITEYAPLAAGCITRMLTREGDDACVNAIPPTLPEMALAIQRLRSGFVFVGITEQWDMSICLFHAKYGGQCQAYEMVNTRPGRYLSTDHPSYYDTEELGGFTDVFDRQLYMEAVAMFEEDVERYGISREYCARACGSQ